MPRASFRFQSVCMSSTEYLVLARHKHYRSSAQVNCCQNANAHLRKFDLETCIGLYATDERQLAWGISGYWHLVHMICMDGNLRQAGQLGAPELRPRVCSRLRASGHGEVRRGIRSDWPHDPHTRIRSRRSSSAPSRSRGRADRRARRLPRRSCAL
jgi:hypothetical protein